MKKSVIFLFFPILLLACQSTSKNETGSPLITRNDPELRSDIMTPEVLWSFGRLSDVQVSPSGDKILYGVTYYSIEQNGSNRELFVMQTDGSGKVQLTETPQRESNAVWTPDGKKIVYLSPASGNTQAWMMNPDGTGKKQVSNIGGGINSLSISPAGDKVYYTKDVKTDTTREELYPDLPKADARIITDLMYRHWDTWEDGAYSHIFVADFNGQNIDEGKDIMPGEPYETPLMPFGGPEEICWSPDGKNIAYTCKKLKGIDYTLSTNSDIFLYNLETGETKNLTDGMPGYDKAPLFSPDGSKIYWLSMERAAFEADKDRLFELNLETGQKRYLTGHFDHSPSGLVWADEGENLYFIAGVQATFQIYRMNVATKDIKAVTAGDHDYHFVAPAEGTLIATRVDMTKPEEIYRVDPETGDAVEISFENKHILDKLTTPSVEKRWIITSDNKQMLTWIIYPPHFDAGKSYPTLLYCEGGPQSALSQFWSYRWNFSQMASNGYIVVAPNRRGVLTMGQEWTDQISKDNSGQAMQDLLRAIDVMKEEPFIDENRLGAIGASFGGFSVFWLAGNHEGRFKAFIAHCGVFNSEMEYMTTDEMFFDNWEKGGAPWETDNPTAMKSYAGSPHNFVQNWDTPILVIHGEHDYRIPYTQAIAAFNSAQLLGVPSKLLFFPSETHWVLSPQNGILWQREFKGWLDRWLKNTPAP
ncbi:MAG: S9 family peptidase [Bacteroidales bacterium]|nr:S9 family peptidase [Bacteroidales bacterium]